MSIDVSKISILKSAIWLTGMGAILAPILFIPTTLHGSVEKFYKSGGLFFVWASIAVISIVFSAFLVIGTVVSITAMRFSSIKIDRGFVLVAGPTILKIPIVDVLKIDQNDAGFGPLLRITRKGGRVHLIGVGLSRDPLFEIVRKLNDYLPSCAAGCNQQQTWSVSTSA